MTDDPSIHRQREQQVIQHALKLLEEERLRVDTVLGRRPVTGFIRNVNRSDQGMDMKRMMSELGLNDRDLQNSMPVGESIDVTLSRQKLIFFRQTVGRLRIVCVSPTKALLTGQEPAPLNTVELQKLLASQPPSLGGVPSTVVVVSTSGFTLEAHELAERRADRTVILLEPNEAGGWTVTGPAETKALADLFDPEAEAEKRDRLRAAIEENRVEMLSGGVAADKIAAKAKLPVQLVEAEVKAYAKANPGLVAKRLDGRVVLFREGTAPVSRADSGGSTMPLLERMKALFGRKGENEKKIAFLSERRAALSQQADRAYEEMSVLEGREEDLKRQFKEASGTITKRRVTGQMLQLRKDLERRQQLLTVLNQQVNVVSTHLHNLSLVQQGQTAKLPDTDEITADAVKAEEMLAQLEADSELAGSVGQTAVAGMSAEEQALFDELEAESGGKAPEAEVVEEEGFAAKPQAQSTKPAFDSAQARQTAAEPNPSARLRERKEAEPG